MIFFQETLDTLEQQTQKSLDLWRRGLVDGNKKVAETGKNMLKEVLKHFGNFIEHHKNFLDGIVGLLGRENFQAQNELVKARATVMQFERSKERLAMPTAQAKLTEAQKRYNVVNATYKNAISITAPFKAELVLIGSDIKFCIEKTEANDANATSLAFHGDFSARYGKIKGMALQDVSWAENVVAHIRANESDEMSKKPAGALKKMKEIEEQVEKAMISLEAAIRKFG